MEEMSDVFLLTSFFTATHFHLALVAACISHFVTVFYLSLQISVALVVVELHWPAAYFLFFSVFLLL